VRLSATASFEKVGQLSSDIAGDASAFWTEQCHCRARVSDDRPEWLVQLAWEVADHKTAVSIGLGAARLSSTASDTRS
jgi:hypothetical protein